MKSFLKTILFFSFSFPSYLSLYGFGEYLENNRSLSYFITEQSPYFVENNSGPLIWDDYQTIFSIAYDMRLNKMNNNQIYSSYLSSLSYTIPVGESKVLTFGLNPHTLANIDFQETSYNYIGVGENSNLTTPLSYNTNYISDGGISRAYLNFTYKVSDKVYLGIKNSHLFGNLEHQKVIRLYDINYGANNDGEFDIDSTLYTLNDSMIINKVNEFNGNTIQLEGKYVNDNNEFLVSGTYNFPLKIKMKMFLNPFVNPSNESLGIFDSLEEMEYYTDPDQFFSYKLDPIIKNYSLGYRWRYNKKSMFFRLIKQNADNVNSNLIYLKEPDITSIDIIYTSNQFFSNFEDSNYSIGLFYKVLETSNSNDYDYGISSNFNLRFIDKDAFNISFRIGERTHNLLEIDKERYFFIRLNLENIEKWFIKGEN